MDERGWSGKSDELSSSNDECSSDKSNDEEIFSKDG